MTGTGSQTIALFGAGRIGQLHGRLLAAQPGVDAIVVNDVDLDRARTTAEAIGGRVATSVDEALTGASAVVIAASTNVHAELVSRAIEAGLPTFVEKPLAFDLDSTIALVDQAEAAHAVVQVGFQRRFDPAIVEARRRIDAGDVGTVYLVRLIAHDHEPPPDAYIPVSGGLFADSSIHDFDILRWITGQEVAEVYATGSVRGFPVFAAHGDVDTGAVILTMADGTLAVLGQTRHNPRGYDIRMEIVGSKDAIAVGLDERTPIHPLPDRTTPGVGTEAGWSSFLDRFDAAYRAELLAFLDLARGRGTSACTARDGLEAMRIAVAATRSRHEHRPVRLDEIP